MCLGCAGGHEELEAALHKRLLRPEEHRLGQLRASANPVIEARLRDLGATRCVDDAQNVADGLVVTRLEGELWLLADKAHGHVVRIALASRALVGEEVRQPGHLLLDLRLELLHLRLCVGQLSLQGLDLFARLWILLALFAQGVALCAHLLDAVYQVQVLLVHRIECVDIHVAAAAQGVLLNRFRVLTEDFNVNHVLLFGLW